MIIIFVVFLNNYRINNELKLYFITKIWINLLITMQIFILSSHRLKTKGNFIIFTKFLSVSFYLLCSSHVFILVLLLNCLYFFMFSTRRKYYCSVRCAMTLMKILLPQDSAMNIANIIIHFTCRLIFMSSIFLLTHIHYLTNVKEDVECDY